MGKRWNVRGHNSRRSGDAVSIQPGDVLTTDDLLGTDPGLIRGLPPAGWLRGEASPCPMGESTSTVLPRWHAVTSDPCCR
jgi:hypothetical protein